MIVQQPFPGSQFSFSNKLYYSVTNGGNKEKLDAYNLGKLFSFMCNKAILCLIIKYYKLLNMYTIEKRKEKAGNEITHSLLPLVDSRFLFCRQASIHLHDNTTAELVSSCNTVKEKGVTIHKWTFIQCACTSDIESGWGEQLCFNQVSYVLCSNQTFLFSQWIVGCIMTDPSCCQI